MQLLNTVMGVKQVGSLLFGQIVNKVALILENPKNLEYLDFWTGKSQGY